MNQYPRIGVGVIVEDGGKVLFGKRRGPHGGGTWAPPGGHLEFGETVEACAKRELLEETGLIATALSVGPWVDEIMENAHYVSIFMFVKEFSGSVQNLEPKKCEEWGWFSLKNLPHPLFPSLANFLKRLDELMH